MNDIGRYVSWGILACLNTIVPVVLRKVTDMRRVVMISECVKYTISATIATVSGRMFPDDATIFMKLSVPSFLYYLQNLMIVYGATRVPGWMFLIITQLKIPLTAFMGRIVLGKTLDMRRWLCIWTITAGVMLATIPKKSDVSPQGQSSDVVGMYILALSSVVSVFNGLYTEKMLKHSQDMWVTNAEIAFWSVIVSSTAYATTASTTTATIVSDIIPIGIMSMFGIFTAIVLKRFDSMWKNNSHAVSIILIIIFEQHKTDFTGLISSAVVMAGVVMYGVYDTSIVSTQPKEIPYTRIQ